MPFRERRGGKGGGGGHCMPSREEGGGGALCPWETWGRSILDFPRRRLHARNPKIQAAQSRCIPCDLGLTTDDFGAVNVTECKPPPPPPVAVGYPENMTCAELLLAFRNSTDELVFVGDGLCNPGRLVAK